MRDLVDPSADQGAVAPSCRITSADGSESDYMFDEDEVQVVAVVSSFFFCLIYKNYHARGYFFLKNFYILRPKKNRFEELIAEKN